METRIQISSFATALLCVLVQSEVNANFGNFHIAATSGNCGATQKTYDRTKAT